MLMLLLYYWPICDLLSAQCYLYKNWCVCSKQRKVACNYLTLVFYAYPSIKRLKLYHIEKLRAKMAPRFVGRTEPTPVQRKKKATLRLNQVSVVNMVC